MIYDIKDLTYEKHKNAERQAFVKILMSGEIDEQLYATYLYNQLQCYSTLEKYGMHNSLFNQTPGLQRAEALHYDYKTLWKGKEPPAITESTKDYIKHLDAIMDDAEKLYAHIYVRHLGDLSGGQMIMRKTPGPNRYYKFKHNQVKEYKRIVREIVNNYLNVYQVNIVAEANYCFDSATRLFGEMYDLGQTN
jgi:heme oxygenase